MKSADTNCAGAGVPRCPRCRSKKIRKLAEKSYLCTDCWAEFDGIDDGIVGYGSPEKYAERAERRQQRKAVKR